MRDPIITEILERLERLEARVNAPPSKPPAKAKKE